MTACGQSAPLCAAGIADYWIVNLAKRQLKIYRKPEPDLDRPGRFRYAEVTIVLAGGHGGPLGQTRGGRRRVGFAAVAIWKRRSFACIGGASCENFARVGIRHILTKS